MRKIFLLLLLLSAVAAAVWFFLVYRPSPRYAVARLAAAVAVRDTAAIYEHADLTAIAEGLATDVQSDAGRIVGRVLRGGDDGPEGIRPHGRARFGHVTSTMRGVKGRHDRPKSDLGIVAVIDYLSTKC